MSSLIDDVLNERVALGVANTMVNATGKALKATELGHRYGVAKGKGKVLHMFGTK